MATAIHFNGDKAPRLPEKEEGCKVQGNDSCLAGHNIQWHTSQEIDKLLKLEPASSNLEALD